MSELMRAMVDEEKSRRDGYIENITKCRAECMRLAEELETSFEEPPEDFTVLKKEKVLRNQVIELKLWDIVHARGRNLRTGES